MKQAILSAFILVMLGNVSLGSDLELKALSLANHVSSKLRQVELVMQRAADLLKHNRDASEVVLQASLREYGKEVPGLRALLFIRPDGTLMLDSTRYPAVALNLSDRDYFKKASGERPGNVAVGRRVVGQQSGVPFVPLATRVENLMGELDGVLVAVVTPDSLIHEMARCDYCFTALFLDGGELLFSSPAEMDLGLDFFQTLGTGKGGRGLVETSLRDYPARAFWVTLDGYPIVVTNGAVLPNS